MYMAWAVGSVKPASESSDNTTRTSLPPPSHHHHLQGAPHRHERVTVDRQLSPYYNHHGQGHPHVAQYQQGARQPHIMQHLHHGAITHSGAPGYTTTCAKQHPQGYQITAHKHHVGNIRCQCVSF